MTWLLLEAPLLLAVVLVVVLGGMFIRWRQVQTAGWQRAMLIALGMAMGLMVVNVSVTTPRERTEAVVGAMLQAIEADGLQATIPFLHADFGESPAVRERLIETITDLDRRFEPTFTELRADDIEASREGEAIVATLQVRGIVAVRVGRAPIDQNRLRLELAPESADGAWRVRSVGILELKVGGQDVPNLQRWRVAE